MKRKHAAACRVALFFTPVFFLSCRCGPDLSQYDVLKEPRISTKPKQKMIVVELKGDPSETAGKAFPVLFKTYYGLKKQAEGMETTVAPRARWPEPAGTPKHEWVGIYGLPVPESVTHLPDHEGEGINVRLEYWEYGEVAEILHVGPYSEEEPAVKKIHAFIRDRGYEIAGAHEEEYLKGPGMFFKGNPEKYRTIIRYPVRKKNQPAEAH